jgi:hypothetical protein
MKKLCILYIKFLIPVLIQMTLKIKFGDQSDTSEEV